MAVLKGVTSILAEYSDGAWSSTRPQLYLDESGGTVLMTS
jgi:hypothetical protein